MTFITNALNNENCRHETQTNTYQRDCFDYRKAPSRKKSNCHTIARAPSFQGCVELSVDKCRVVRKTNSPNGSKSKLCDTQSPRVKRSPNASTSNLCSPPTTSKQRLNGFSSNFCATHIPSKQKNSPCASRKSSKQHIQGNACTEKNWCDCRSLPTERIDCDKKICVVGDEGQYVRKDWWCDCRGVSKCTGKKVCVRPGPIIPKGNLRMADSALQDETTYKADYTGKYLPPRVPIKPHPGMHGAGGPMSSLTTHKVDYQPKPHSKRGPIYPTNAMPTSKHAMEGETTTMHDYQVPRGFIPSQSFRPGHKCKSHQDPMQDETTHKADYVDWHSRGPQGPFPWTPGNKFKYPTIPMVGDTTYKTDYRRPGLGGRTSPIVPKGQGIGIFGNAFDSCTTYKHDYVPWECVNEYDYNPPQNIKCYKLEGETPSDPEKKLWCYKTNDVCPYYPPKPIDGAIPGTTQYVVRPSEGDKPCKDPKEKYNAHICDSEALLRITCPPKPEVDPKTISGCESPPEYSYRPQPVNEYASPPPHQMEPCTNKSYRSCEPPVQETKPYKYTAHHECNSSGEAAKPYAPAAIHHEPYDTSYQCCSKNTNDITTLKPNYSMAPKFDQNCACMTQPTSRYTTQPERVLTVHC